MKKIYLLPLLALFFASCSVDDSAEILKQEAAVNVVAQDSTNSASRTAAPAALADCFKGVLGAHINLDLSNGINNPIINFISDAPASVNPNWSFLLTVEVQQLSDCENPDRVTGPILVFGGTTAYTNITATHPGVAVLPSALPSCYKWRITLERTGKLAPQCKTYSAWYDAPLF